MEAGTIAQGPVGDHPITQMKDRFRAAPAPVRAAISIVLADIVVLMADHGFPATFLDLPVLQALGFLVVIAITTAAVTIVRSDPRAVVAVVLLHLAAVLGILTDYHAVIQNGVNGIVAGSYFALGAIGLTLVYGILKLTNFAHGDMLTFGAYIGILFNVTLGVPIAVAVIVAVVATAALGVASELLLWGPMRRKKAGALQLVLMSIGLAFVIRYAAQYFAGARPRSLDVDTTSSVGFLRDAFDISIGQTEAVVVIVAFVVLTAVALMLRSTSLGRQMRALADNFDLAETTGIDTGRVVLATWLLAGGLAGLAGILVIASIGQVDPNTGFQLLLSLFAAVVLGGIGNAFGALAGGLVIGLAQEWSVLVLPSPWKVAVSFIVLIGVLVVRPQGIFGNEQSL